MLRFSFFPAKIVLLSSISKWVELYCRTRYRLVMPANTRNLVMDFPCMPWTRGIFLVAIISRERTVPPGPNTSYPLELETYSRFLRSRRTRNATPTSTKSILRYLIQPGREIFDAPYMELREGRLLIAAPYKNDIFYLSKMKKWKAVCFTTPNQSV